MSTEETPPVETSNAAPVLPARTPLPDVADIIFLLMLYLMLSLLPNYVLGDGSTGWHLATGMWILDHGSIPHTDLFSNTFPNNPWVPYEWLSDVVGALLVRVGTLKLLAVATACAIAWLFSLVYLECRRGGCHVAVALVLTILAALTSSIHWLARPHIFTFFGVFLLSRHLEKYRTGVDSRKRLLITIAVLMTLWSNLHPAFLVGFALIIIYLSSEIVVWLCTSKTLRSASTRRLQTFAMALVLAIACSFINPNAGMMYGYIFHYLQQSYVLQNTQEFMQANFHELHALCMLILFFIFIGALACARRSIGLAPLLTMLAFAYLGLNSMRNEPLFAIIAVPITGALFGSFSLRKIIGKPFANADWLERWLTKSRRITKDFDEMERISNMHLLPILSTVLLAIACPFGGKIGPVELVTSDWDPINKPTKTLRCIEEYKLNWRNGLNLDNWGGYIYYVTNNRVFVDDRLDFYGSNFFIDYKKMSQLDADWRQVMDKHEIKWILFPAKGPLIEALRKSPEWQLLCEDKGSAVMVRKPAAQ
jgi:hypothetical protein